MEKNYLRRRTMEVLHTENLDKDLCDLSLNQLMSAFAELVSASGDDKSPPMDVSPLARHYAQKLVTGLFVVFRDPSDNITYYVKAHGYDLVAVFHPLGPWYNRWMAIASTESILVSLGITTAAFTDITILDRIFGWPAENLINDVPTADVTTDQRPFWRWHIAGAPKIRAAQAVEVLAERNAETPELKTVQAAAEPSTPDSVVELSSEGVQPVIAIPQTAMGQAFAGAMNQPRGGERRDGDRRRGGGAERREMARDANDHTHLAPHTQALEQVLDQAAVARQ
jgi:hypothetical protein